MDSDNDVKPTTPPAYRVNATLRIREHLPPHPFTGDYGPSPRPPINWKPWKGKKTREIDRVKLALANPPIDTGPPGEVEHTLTITGSKTRRTRGGAHVLTCFLDGNKSAEYVAKVYDSVYYPLGDRNGHDIDGMSLADRDYSIEAWAYRLMQPVIGGVVVPAYHGSWTFQLDTNQAGQRRWVRMIIIELIKGECMLDIIRRADTGLAKPNYVLLPPEPFRLRVLQNIIEAETRISWETAINHNDLDARNVMVKPDGNVVLIDFNQAYIELFSCYDESKNYKKGNPTALPPTPLERYWHDVADSVGPWRKWLPKTWLENEELGREWLIQTYRNSTKYKPLSEHFLHAPSHETWSPRLKKLLRELGCETGKEVSISTSET